MLEPSTLMAFSLELGFNNGRIYVHDQGEGQGYSDSIYAQICQLVKMTFKGTEFTFTIEDWVQCSGQGQMRLISDQGKTWGRGKIIDSEFSPSNVEGDGEGEGKG